jgi:hypothetical protein
MTRGEPKKAIRKGFKQLILLKALEFINGRDERI